MSRCKLREYRTKDAPSICSWIRDEISFYEWSAGVLGEYPITADHLDERLRASMAAGRFMAFTYADEDDSPAGHMIIRYPDEGNDELLRFGFVIIDPDLRGRGLGRSMLTSAFEYSRVVLHAKKVTLAVFTRNEKALRCYTAAGFRQTGGKEIYRVPSGEWESILLEKDL